MVLRTDRPRRFNIFLLSYGENRRADDPCELRNVGNAQREADVKDIGLERTHDSNGKKKARDRKKNVRTSHDDIVQSTSVISAYRAECAADEQRKSGGSQTYREGGACAVNDTAQHIPAHLIGSKPVFGRRLLQAVGNVDLTSVCFIIPEQIRCTCRQHYDREDKQRQHGDLIFPEPFPDLSRLTFLFLSVLLFCHYRLLLNTAL